MAEINLTEENMLNLQRCLNEGMEPPQELAKKLFPSMYASFDFKTLKDSKIPTIEYQGKRTEAAILSEASVFGGGSPLQLERSFDGGRINKNATQLQLFNESTLADDTSWRNLIVQGDNLQFLKTCFLNQDPIIKDRVKGKVKLVYIDPPFGTGDEYGGNEGQVSYTAKIKGSEYIEAVRERVLFLREMLEPEGCLILRIDYHFGPYLRVVLDETFGRENFRNEVIINRIFKNVFGDSKFIPTSTDTLYVYSKTNTFKYKDVKVERDKPRDSFWRHMDDSAGIRSPQERRVFGVVLYPPQGKHFKYNQKAIDQMISEGRIRLKCQNCGYIHDDINSKWRVCPVCKDSKPKLQYLVKESSHIHLQSNWTDIPGYSTQWKYPTENSEQLLERVIRACSVNNDLVMDVFGGSGTTAAVAEKLGRRWIMCDFGKHAVYTMQKRICGIADSQKLDTGSNKKVRYNKAPESFCVVSVGVFDFGKIMNMRQNRDADISFVMGIFGITARDDSLSKKYNISHVLALKENNPVEIYPIWDDEFLKNIRVDEDYLKGILAQSGGKLKGDYYIVAPETCVRIGETELKNEKGDKVVFKMLTFPYKVLEEIARNFSIEEQPSSPDNINKLISSVGFYFNEEVNIAVKKTAKGFKIREFKTSILNSDEKRYEGLDGLAMVLIDTEYDDEKGFTVDTVIYQKDIKGEEVHADGISADSAIIAIDKHGNESKITMIR